MDGGSTEDRGVCIRGRVTQSTAVHATERGCCRASLIAPLSLVSLGSVSVLPHVRRHYSARHSPPAGNVYPLSIHLLRVDEGRDRLVTVKIYVICGIIPLFSMKHVCSSLKQISTLTTK